MAFQEILTIWVNLIPCIFWASETVQVWEEGGEEEEEAWEEVAVEAEAEAGAEEEAEAEAEEEVVVGAEADGKST